MMSLFHFASSQTISCKLWAAGTNAYSYISPFPQQRRSQDPKFIDVQAKENENVPRLTKLATPNELPLIYPIRYAYDPVPIIPPYLNSSPSITLTANSNDVHSCLRQNSCQLYPKAANLPYRSSLPLIRCNRHWQAVLNESKTVLQLLAHDQSASDVEVGHGITLARLAKKELKPDIEHRIVLATIYMFPAGDEKKIRAIAALMIIYFIFDGQYTYTFNSNYLGLTGRILLDKVEETPDCTVCHTSYQNR